MKYEMFYVKNMQDTDILCAVANHEDRVISFEQHPSATNMVGYCKMVLCNHIVEETDYTIVFRDLDNYVRNNNIQ